MLKGFATPDDLRELFIRHFDIAHRSPSVLNLSSAESWRRDAICVTRGDLMFGKFA